MLVNLKDLFTFICRAFGEIMANSKTIYELSLIYFSFSFDHMGRLGAGSALYGNCECRTNRQSRFADIQDARKSDSGVRE